MHFKQGQCDMFVAAYCMLPNLTKFFLIKKEKLFIFHHEHFISAHNLTYHCDF